MGSRARKSIVSTSYGSKDDWRVFDQGSLRRQSKAKKESPGEDLDDDSKEGSQAGAAPAAPAAPARPPQMQVQQMPSGAITPAVLAQPPTAPPGVQYQLPAPQGAGYPVEPRPVAGGEHRARPAENWLYEAGIGHRADQPGPARASKGLERTHQGAVPSVMTIEQNREANEFFGNAAMQFCNRMQGCLHDLKREAMILAQLCGGNEEQEVWEQLAAASAGIDDLDPDVVRGKAELAARAQELAGSCEMFSHLWEPRLRGFIRAGPQEHVARTDPFPAHAGGKHIAGQTGLFPMVSGAALTEPQNAPGMDPWVLESRNVPHFPAGVRYNVGDMYPTVFGPQV